ncbi:MAG: hypothetical protein V1903_04615 [Bacteroidota bacterium]
MDKNDDYAWKIILWLILFLVFGIIIIACRQEPSGYIMTVNGLVHPSEMGLTLNHKSIRGLQHKDKEAISLKYPVPST